MKKRAINKAQKAMQSIKVIRSVARTRHAAGLAAEVVTLTCAGGCGTTHRVRTSKIRNGQLFICNAQKTRALCSISIPQTMGGLVRHDYHQAAGPLTGVSYVRGSASTKIMLTIFDACIGQPVAAFGRWAIARRNRMNKQAC